MCGDEGDEGATPTVPASLVAHPLTSSPLRKESGKTREEAASEAGGSGTTRGAVHARPLDAG